MDNMQDQIVIGVSGKRRSGKSTLAGLLKEDLGFEEFSFAVHLKMLESGAYAIHQGPEPVKLKEPSKLTRIVYLYRQIFGPDNSPDHTGVAQDILDMFDQEEFRTLSEDGKRRRALQHLGTEILRSRKDNIHCEALTKYGLYRIPDHANMVVVPDLRFPNEAEALVQFAKDKGCLFLTVRVERPSDLAVTDLANKGFDANAAAHPSETALDDYPFDITIQNDSTPLRMLEQLYWEAGRFFRSQVSDFLPVIAKEGQDV